MYGESDWGTNNLLYPVLVVALMAVAILGNERNNMGAEQFLAMPLRRSDIFWSKWLYGAVSILLALLINILGVTISFLDSPISSHVSFLPFLQYFGFAFLALLTVFTFVLMMGMIAGNTTSHLALGVVGIVFPRWIYGLAETLVEWHYYWMTQSFFLRSSMIHDLFPIIRYITLLPAMSYSFTIESSNGLNFARISFSASYYWTLIAYLVLSLSVGYFLFIKNPMERNGNLIVYKKWEPFIRWNAIVGGSITVGVIFGHIFARGLNQAIAFYGLTLGSGIVLYFILQRFSRKTI